MPSQNDRSKKEEHAYPPDKPLRIAFVYPTGHVFDTPCVTNLIKHLGRNGIDVDVYLVHNTETPSGNLSRPRVKVHTYPWVQKRANENVALLSLGFGVWYAIRSAARHYDFTIACGIRGLFVVGLVAPVLRQPYAYNSLELYSGPKFGKGPRRWFKHLEQIFNQRAQLSIIQDACRAKLLSRINRLGNQEVCLFPNAPDQESEALAVGMQPTGSKYGLKETDRLIISSGSFEKPWSGIGKILSAVPQFPSGHVLFLQSRYKLHHHPDESLKKHVSEGRVIWSSDPLSAEDYDQLVRNSYIGVAWYESEDENILYVGLSSGKIAHYLRWAKPVVVNRLPLLAELFEKYGCGVVVDSEQGIGPALEKIDRDYEKYADGARRAYQELFDMDRYARALVKAIGAHAKRS